MGLSTSEKTEIAWKLFTSGLIQIEQRKIVIEIINEVLTDYDSSPNK